MKFIERWFEAGLWHCRFVILAAVVMSVLSAMAMIFIATVDAWYMLSHLFEYASPTLDTALRKSLRAETVTHIVEVVDGFLLGAVLLIFGLGLYELFISRLDVAYESETSSNVLFISSLDELKTRLAKVILMILIVRFFEVVLAMRFDEPLTLLYLSGGIALIGIGLYFSHKAEE